MFRSRTPSPVASVMAGAAVVTAQLVGGKAARDALFLGRSAWPHCRRCWSPRRPSRLPWWRPRLDTRSGSAPFAPCRSAYLASAALLAAEWLLRPAAPAAMAVAIYLHVSCLGPVLASGFWLLTTERFDPRSAKRQFGRIAAAGTLGGLLSAVAAPRIAALGGIAAVLPCIAMLQGLCAWLITRLPQPHGTDVSQTPGGDGRTRPAGRWHVVATTPALRHLALLVLLGATGAALLDYLFKLQAVATFGRDSRLFTFLSAYYAVVSLATFVIQVSAGRAVMERCGPA